MSNATSLVKRTVDIPLCIRLTWWSRVRVLFGARIGVVLSTNYGIYEPKALGASARVGILDRKAPAQQEYVA